MAESKATIPDFAVTIEVDAEGTFAMRDRLRDVVDPLPSLNDFVIAACARALREHPRVNGPYRDGRFELYDRINVGMAVALESSLVVPTIFAADTKRLSDLARETRRLAAAARAGTITQAALAGGTFTVSNLGMFDVARFIAVVNHPQAAILAVGAAVPRAVPQADGSFASRRVLELTLSADHRIVYGAEAAVFLGLVRELLENPLALVV
jgi:pyruvate dehydrogenase E2 component (dihydrolipoamide acetyltransferase)